MKFSLWTPARMDLPPLALQAEAAGFSYLHLYDSQLLYAELYASMALCAAATTRINVGPGVTNSLTRMSSVTANGLASINQIAPGRTFLAIGSGYTSMKAMGFGGASLRELRRYIREVRALVSGEAIEYEFRGDRRMMRMIHQRGSVDDTFYNLSDPIPIYVAAGGPKSTELAGEVADAVIFSVKNPADIDLATVRRNLAAGARRAGRSVEDIRIFVMLNMYVLEDGERATSREVKESALGVWQSQIGSWAARRPPTPGTFDPVEATAVPPDVAPVADAYRRALAEESGGTDVHPLDRPEWYLDAYNGHAWRLHSGIVDEISEEFLRSRALIASPDEIVELLERWEAMGVSAVGPHLQHDLERGAEQIRRFGEHIIPAFAG
ncbi:LLM class flavin-dependent oxidoreductase [Microbacterium pygmaeum]|uniref:Luciferase-like monooxygenase n=1 Tax=Microbacterium pygmaeum TaxID=370764 RepID=A0A1G7XAN3_9MICO|nr:LLM class flavin-dependent oxidoreductase [Microbacterium pygmaeum]SDG81315.1 Luciferase-like monooxygenase [Microbacterium pygmaeum]